jgi:GntR family transcriptional regulator
MALIAFHIDSRSGLPYYVQLIEQVRHAVRLGLLGPDDQLPTVRDVVGEVAVNPNTVLRAYRELEHEGLVIMRPGLGTFVAPETAAALDHELYRSLRHELATWIEDARRRGVDEDTLAALFDHVLHKRWREATA